MSLNNFLSTLDLSSEFQTHFLDVHTLVIQSFNQEYEKIHHYQNLSNEWVQVNPQDKIYFITSHPHVFTMGKGLQRSGPGEGAKVGLVDFKEENSLKFPVHKIFRGGGLTFHYPGQWIFYPIVKLNTTNLTLNIFIDKILITTAQTLNELYHLDASSSRDFLGVWVNRRKVASLGVGVKKFVTLHGLALNFYHDQEMFDELKKCSPCGLSPLTYQCIDQLLTKVDREIFTKTFLQNFNFYNK